MHAFLVPALLAALFGSAEIVSTEAQQRTTSGDAKLSAGDPAGAADDYRAAIAADPKAFEARVNLGAALLKLNDAEGAVDVLESARKAKADAPQVLRNLGRAYMKLERWEEAASVLSDAIRVDDSHPDGPRLLGIAMHRAGRHSTAVPVLRRALEAKPQDLELLVELATAEIDAGETSAGRTVDRARKAAAQAKDSRMRNELGLLLRRLGRNADALDEFRGAAKTDPTYTAAVANLGMALLEAGDAKAAAGTLATAAKQDMDPEIRFYLGEAKLLSGDPKGAIPHLEQARAWGYDPSRIAASLALAHEKIGDAKKADAERAMAKGAAGLAVADADAEEGLALLKKGKYEDAARRLAAATKARPDDGAAWFNLGLAKLRHGDAAGAEDALSRAAKLLPKESVVWYSLGDARRRAGDRVGEVEAWEALLAIERGRTDVSARLGSALLELDRNDAAVAPLMAAEKGLPNAIEVKHDLAVALLRAGRVKDALPRLAAVLAAEPGDHRTREAYAEALLDAGDAKKAIAEWTKLASAESRVARHRVNLAVVHRKLGDVKSEKAALAEAAKLAPDDAQVWNDLGRLQFAERQWADAAASFERAAALDPSLREAAANAATAKKNAGVESMKTSRLHLGVVIAKTKADAEAGRVKVMKKRDAFAEVARTVSTHDSAKNGGDLQWVDPATLPAWAAAAKDLKPGSLSAVVEVPGGFAFFYRYP